MLFAQFRLPTRCLIACVAVLTWHHIAIAQDVSPAPARTETRKLAPPQPATAQEKKVRFEAEKCQEQPPNERETYIVQFDQAAARFIYPPHPAFDNDEIVLKICNSSAWKRYRLVFGSKTVGDDAISSTTVGYTATQLDAALRGATSVLANDHTCNDPEVIGTAAAAEKAEKPKPDLTAQCQRLRREVTALAEVAKSVIGSRDELASLIAECGSLPALGGTSGFDERCATLLVDGLHGPGGNLEAEEIGAEANDLLQQYKVDQEIVWVDDAWHLVERGTGNEPSLGSNPGEQVLPPSLIGYINTRAQLVAAIQQAMDGFSKLSALSLRMREDLARRQTVFRIGRFPGNRIVVATLEEHTVRVGFTQDRKRLRFGTEVVPHQLSLNVEKTSFVQIDLGIAFSSADEPRYKSVVNTVGGAPTTTVQEDTDGRDLSPVIFASFLWCAQDLGRPWISRTCRDGTKGLAYAAPRLAVGLPLNANLGRGSLYAGLSLPYIPYVSLIGGLHAKRVEVLNGISEGDPVPESGIPTTATLKFGFFGSIGITEEIFNLLVPHVEAAK